MTGLLAFQSVLCRSQCARLAALVVAGFALVHQHTPASAASAVIYRWIDKQGHTHFGDAVPSEYKDVAKPVDSKAASPTPEAQRRAIESAAALKEKLRAAQALKTATPAGASAPTPRPASAATAPRRPPNAPTEGTDCATWQRLYRESLDCFGPYRTARGATKAEAFSYCTPVVEPPPRCGRNAP